MPSIRGMNIRRKKMSGGAGSGSKLMRRYQGALEKGYTPKEAMAIAHSAEQTGDKRGTRESIERFARRLKRQMEK